MLDIGQWALIVFPSPCAIKRKIMRLGGNRLDKRNDDQGGSMVYVGFLNDGRDVAFE